MSHSSLEDLEYFINLSQEVGIPFILDTEGSQIRTGDLKQDQIHLKENDELNEQIIKLQMKKIVYPDNLNLSPKQMGLMEDVFDFKNLVEV